MSTHSLNHARLVAETTADHWRQGFEEEHRKLDHNPAGEVKRKSLYKYNLTLKTESPGEVNRPVLQRPKDNLELWKTVARKIILFSETLTLCERIT